MFDRKTIRRRRLALAGFLLASLVLISAYVGNPASGLVGILARGTQAAFSPLERGLSRALKPIDDLAGWVHDSLRAKSENERLRAEVARLRRELAEAQIQLHDGRELARLERLTTSAGFPAGTAPVTARVIARSPTVWYSAVTIDRGSADGIRVDQPVVAAGGLVGRVSSVSPHTARVRLITDAASAVAAQLMPDGANGIVRPSVGDPRDLVLDFIQDRRRVKPDAIVITSGFDAGGLASVFPRGIPIGRVTRVDPEEVELYQRVHIRPFADLGQLDIVQVLTRRPTARVGLAQITGARQ
ncbi:rod shape-determining protein MreC [Thermoleophilum album]|uniref:Cell shape-determining protein MreC n=1 Tax=Thermoleophilum album TaxID=29539 RepID=A0A1H6FUU4_THEAL|nr:rod shape-determining protein MreC [Thermoleophilum album]SEH13928.1 rod shape-determining protein MreC [Thermoleophilum album]